MSFLRRLTARSGLPTDDAELDRIHAYESTQRDICQTAGARFDPPDTDKLVAVAPSVLSGHLPVRGSRHLGETVEWSILADDQPTPPIEELSYEHLQHLATLREDLVMYLALPIGWSFAVLADGLRTWAAFSPSDHLRADIEEFLSHDRTPGTAEMIKSVLDESFGGIGAASELSVAITSYLTEGRGPADLEAKLLAIYDVVRGTSGDGRLT
jgi:hypothetical protein